MGNSSSKKQLKNDKPSNSFRTSNWAKLPVESSTNHKVLPSSSENEESLDKHMPKKSPKKSPLNHRKSPKKSPLNHRKSPLNRRKSPKKSPLNRRKSPKNHRLIQF